MKKIIMAVAAIAMAVSMFAADISAATRIDGELFKYGPALVKDANDNDVWAEYDQVRFFKQGNGSQSYSCPNFAVSISDDKAGASFKITTGGNDAPVLKDQTIWFKPFDMLKITIGAYDVALNKEQIDWTESNSDLGTEGYLISLDVAGFTVDAGLNVDDGNYWLNIPKDTKVAMPNWFVKFGYNADFGSVGAFISFNKNTKWWGSHLGHYAGNWTFTDKKTAIDFGVGYKGAFGPISTFVNVLGYMYDSKFEWIRPEVFVSGGVDAFGFQLFLAPTIYTNKNFAPADSLPTDPALEIVAKFTYGIGSVTPYLYFKSLDVLAKKGDAKDRNMLTFKLGATGSVGVMKWDVCAQIDALAGANDDKVVVSIPFNLQVAF